MLNAGEGTFCDAEVRVMLQLSPTLSLGDQANTIVLPLRVYPFHLSPAAVPLFAPKSHLVPPLSLYLQETPRLTLSEFLSPPADKMHHR